MTLISTRTILLLTDVLRSDLMIVNVIPNEGIENVHFFVIEQLRRAPIYIFLGFCVLIFAFYFTPVLRCGSTFCTLSPDARTKHVHIWRTSRISLKREFINFFESFLVIALYDNYENASNSLADRQQFQS